jgi:type III secretion protein T
VLSLSLPFLPILHGAVVAAQFSFFDYVAIILKEAFIGLLIGYSAALIFWAVEAIGSFIDNQRGASIASTLDPLSGSDSSPTGTLLFQTFLTFFFVSGGFLIFLGGLYNSYQIWPVLSLLPEIKPGSAELFLHQLDRLMALAVILSAPAIIAMFLSEFGLALVSRFAPQLNVFFLAMPVKSGVALFVLILYLGLLFNYLEVGFAEIRAIFQNLEQILR